MSELKYSNPKENMERGEEPMHTVEIKVDGETIGAAEIEYFSKPMPFYQISALYVEY